VVLLVLAELAGEVLVVVERRLVLLAPLTLVVVAAGEVPLTGKVALAVAAL
jgi:hypothetical protein